MIIKQLTSSGSDNFSYIIGCGRTGTGAVIDPHPDAEAILRSAKRSLLHVRYVINTHFHHDHVGGNDLLRAAGAKVVMHEADAEKYKKPVDIPVTAGFVLPLGNLNLRFIHTPGHTPGSVCVASMGQLFTGDTLFVSTYGRTDLPGGSEEEMKQSMITLLSLPEETVIWPGHHYGSTPSSSVLRERTENEAVVDYGLQNYAWPVHEVIV